MDFERIAASAPVNKTAALQVSRGETWTPRVQILDWYENPPPMKPLPDGHKDDPYFVDFTGREFGRLTVLGLWDKEANWRASWVCRCKCGYYCTRSSKSLKVAARGGNTFLPMCGRCDYQTKLAGGWVFKFMERKE